MAERKNSAARIRANNKNNEKAYDRINIAVKKGDKAKIQEHAAVMNESINAFVIRAIREAMERDNSTTASPAKVKPQAIATEPEQTTLPLPEDINLSELLTDINYQLDIEEAYGFETLRALLDKAKQQKKTQQFESSVNLYDNKS